MDRPNILFIMCDQFRYDCIHALGNEQIQTPHLDRLAEGGVVFDRAYSTCPVCIPARYTLRTGCESSHTGCYNNGSLIPMDGQPEQIEARCGRYLPEALKDLGYRTFGIGKFHTVPAMQPVGFEVQMNVEEMWDTPEERSKDAYADYIQKQCPSFSHIEQLHGERTNMYYVPQTSVFPAELKSEAFVADRAIEQLQAADERPYFGFISFVGPHPPIAPPIPYNRMYNPDAMPLPKQGDIRVDHMDEQIPYMNHLIWADDISDGMAQNIRAHYYGMITYIDDCIGRILKAVREREDADNTVICFFADHGDHLGDHHAWQKESYFEASARIPMILYCPKRWKAGHDRQLICLTDLYGIATQLAGQRDLKDGWPILDVMEGNASERECLFGVYERPGTRQFKIMCRYQEWKYIYMANGGREQLFHMDEDPDEMINRCDLDPEMRMQLRRKVIEYCHQPGLLQALEGDDLKSFAFQGREHIRIRQFDQSRGIKTFAYDFGL